MPCCLEGRSIQRAIVARRESQMKPRRDFMAFVADEAGIEDLLDQRLRLKELRDFERALAGGVFFRLSPHHKR